MKQSKIAKHGFILGLMALLMCSCSSEKGLELATLSTRHFQNSGCKEYVAAAKPMTTGEVEQFKFAATPDGYLVVTHLNAMYNCVGDISTEAFLEEGRTIIINEKEGSVAANCLCPFDISTEFGKLDHGKYTVIVKRNGEEVFRHAIDYNASLSEVVGAAK